MSLNSAALNVLTVAMGNPTAARAIADFLPAADSANTWTATQTFSGAIAHTGTTVGFLSATPAAQATAYTQTYSTAARTVPDATVAAVATTAATQSSPFGYAGGAQADAIPVAINALAADVLALKKVITALIDDLQSFGFVG